MLKSQPHLLVTLEKIETFKRKPKGNRCFQNHTLTSDLYNSVKSYEKLVNKLPFTDLYNSVKSYEKLVNKYPFNAEYRKHLYSLRGRFRRRCKYEEKMFKQNIYVELGNCMDKNNESSIKSCEIIKAIKSLNLLI